MPHRLRNGLSFCRVDGHFVFLDIPNDRYFELPTRLEAIFATYVDGSDVDGAPSDLIKLVEHQILADDPVEGSRAVEPTVERPRLSILEQSASDDAADWRVTLEVLAIVCRTRLRLRTVELENILRDVIRRREHAAPLPTSQPDLSCTMRAAGAFTRARAYVPIDTCCLLDSLSMVNFLARRQIPAHIVFGVVRNPFGAHCWVQSGDVVLNDTVGNVSNHTRILVM